MRTLKLLLASTLAATALLACRTPEQSSSEEKGGVADPKASLTFQKGVDAFVSGFAYPGKSIAVFYDPARSHQCLPNGAFGSQGLVVDLFYGEPGAHPKQIKMSLNGGLAQAVIPPFAKAQDLGIWFRVTVGSCVAWDSNGGKNFAYTVHSKDAEKITFSQRIGEAPATSAAIKAGSVVTVSYNADRVPFCVAHDHEAEGGGHLTMGVKLDENQPVYFSMTHDRLANGEAFEPFGIPFSAKKLSIWFQTLTLDCHHYDSRDGQNYQFNVVP